MIGSLEQIFKDLDWERKFTTFPDGETLFVFRPGEEVNAKQTLDFLHEETEDYYRAAYLFNDSLGMGLAVTEEEWEED